MTASGILAKTKKVVLKLTMVIWGLFLCVSILSLLSCEKSDSNTEYMLVDPEEHIYPETNSEIEEVIPIKYDYVYSFSEGLAAVQLDKKWGFIDKTGKEVIPLQYSEVYSFSEGVAWVSLPNFNGEHSPRLFGLIDKDGNEVLPHDYVGVSSFSEGLARIRINDEYNLIDKTGKTVISGYDSISNFSEGLVAVGFDDIESGGASHKYCYIDKTGRVVTPLSSLVYYYDFQDGLRIDFSEGLAAFRIDETFGFIDKNGNMAIPNDYAFVHGFSEGLSAVWNNGKHGYIDKTGREIISFADEWLSLGNFSESRAYIIKGSYVGYIDKKGEVVIPFVYFCENGHNDWAHDFSEGLVVVIKGNWETGVKYGFIDEAGKEIVPFVYDGAQDVSEGLAAVCIDHEDTGKKWGFIAIK